MASPFSSVLAKLDLSMQAIHAQLQDLGAALEINDDQLGYSLRDGRAHAGMLRDLIRAERPGARWTDKGSLIALIHELEVAAEQRSDQQRRARFLDLAQELQAGNIKHRFESRATALNAMRLEAVKELQREAARSARVKELPGPNASDWLHWACGLQEETDAPVLAELRQGFPAVERFACEMEENYWVPREPRRLAQIIPMAPPATVEPTGNYDEAPSTLAKLEEEEHGVPVATAVGVDDSLIEAISSAAHVSRCPKCDCTFPPDFHVCPFDNSELVPIPEDVPVDRRQQNRRRSDTRAPEATEAQNAGPNGASASGAATQPTDQDLELDKLKALLVERNSSGGHTLLHSFEKLLAHKKLVVACGVAASVIVFAAVLYLKGVSASQLRTTIVTASARAAGVEQAPVQDSDIQKNLQQRLASLKDSSVQATVENGVVTLVGRTPTKWESMHAESLASQADGVKLVKNQVEVVAGNLNAPNSTRVKRGN